LTASTGTVEEYVSHVLPEVDSTTYPLVMKSAGDEILAGCSCAKCGRSDALHLIHRRVRRGLRHAGGRRTELVLFQAVCRACGGCERVLPFDVLSGKTAAVELPLEVCEARSRPGSTIAGVGRQFRVSRATVRAWERGLAARLLDLLPLMRHRAIVARSDVKPEAARLVRFGAFVAEVERHTRGAP